MYDEQVKRLKERAGAFDYDGRPDIACDYEQAADAIAELSRENESLAKSVNEASEILRKRWIPVTERLPEDECPVLATYLGFHDHKPRANMLAYIDRDLGWCWWDDDIPGGVPCSVEITHWQPLPQPPKEE